MRGLLTKAALALAAVVGAGAAAAAPLATDSLLDWAQRQYPGLFPNAQATQTYANFRYRFYPDSGNYVGVADGRVYVLGPTLNGGQLLDLGLAEGFAPLLAATPAHGARWMVLHSYYGIDVALALVDADNPLAAPVVLRAKGSYHTPMLHAELSYDAPTRSFTHQGHAYATYVANGRFYRLALNSSTMPVPEQLSSETRADGICGEVFTLRSQPASTSWIVYTVKGATNDCNDFRNETHLVRLGMAAGEAPLVINGSAHHWLHDRQGRLDGFFVASGGELLRYDTTGQRVQTIGQANGLVDRLGTAEDASGAQLFYFRNGNRIQHYNAQTRVLSQPLLPAPVADLLWVRQTPQDEQGSVFFAVRTSSGQSHAYAHNAVTGGPAQLLFSDHGFDDVRLTPTRLVYTSNRSAQSGLPSRLRSVPKTGGEPIDLVVAPAGTFYTTGNEGDRVFFNLVAGVGGTSGSGYVNAGGGPSDFQPFTDWNYLSNVKPVFRRWDDYFSGGMYKRIRRVPKGALVGNPARPQGYEIEVRNSAGDTVLARLPASVTGMYQPIALFRGDRVVAGGMGRNFEFCFVDLANTADLRCIVP